MSGRHRAVEAWPSPVHVGVDGNGVARIAHGKSVAPVNAYVTPLPVPGHDVIADVIGIDEENITIRISTWLNAGCGSTWAPLRWGAVGLEWRAYTLAELQGAS